MRSISMKRFYALLGFWLLLAIVVQIQNSIAKTDHSSLLGAGALLLLLPFVVDVAIYAVEEGRIYGALESAARFYLQNSYENYSITWSIAFWVGRLSIALGFLIPILTML